MCIAVPVDHARCNHTIALWQHCANALRSLSGLKPCSRVRQHTRPILIRKLCIHCGGPRHFTRRGGIAARGTGSNAMPKKVEWASPYDSGYASDVILEEEEEDYDSDETLSPRARKVPSSWPTVSRQSSSSTYRSQKRESGWSPNLKRELTRRDSISSGVSRDDDTESLYCSQSPDDAGPMDRSTSPISRKSTPDRKNSTLLHPSSPVESFTDEQYTRDVTMGGTSIANDMPMSDKHSRVTIISISEPITPQPTHMSSTPLLLRPRAPPRKPSTLLHPSVPSEDISAVPSVSTLSLQDSETGYPFPVLTHTPPTPLPTDTKFQRRVSVLHSALSEDEWEEPLHSSQSDVESDSEDDDENGTDVGLPNSQNANEAIAVAKSGRKARASRISFHGQHLRILVD